MHPEDQFWVQFARPFVALAFLVVAYLIARVIAPLIPNGRIKRALYDRDLQKRHPWKFGLGLAFGGWGVMFAAYLIFWR